MTELSVIAELQDWYLSQCNENWEHTYGVDIGTLDNPGWSLKIDLTDTPLHDISFAGHSYGIGNDMEHRGDNWLIYKVENGKFVCYGGPKKLEEMIQVFLSWARANT